MLVTQRVLWPAYIHKPAYFLVFTTGFVAVRENEAGQILSVCIIIVHLNMCLSTFLELGPVTWALPWRSMEQKPFVPSTARCNF